MHSNYRYKLFVIARRILKAGYRKNRIRVSSLVLSEKATELAETLYEEFLEKYTVDQLDDGILELYEKYMV